VAMGKDLNGMMRNVMVKMPGTQEGIEGIRILTSLGIPTNATLTFALPQLIAVAEAVMAGLKEAKSKGTDLSKWRSVVTMMLGRFEDSKGMMDGAKAAGVSLSPADLRWAGIAVFKKAYRLFKERGYQSKMLAASMRIGPQVDGKERVWHVEKLAGGDVVLTIFPNIMEAFLQCYEGEDIPPVMDEDAPKDVIAKLMTIPYFRQGFEEDGLTQEEYISYPPVVETAESFAQATDQLQEHVANRMKVVRGK
jgi:transaldolase